MSVATRYPQRAVAVMGKRSSRTLFTELGGAPDGSRSAAVRALLAGAWADLPREEVALRVRLALDAGFSLVGEWDQAELVQIARLVARLPTREGLVTVTREHAFGAGGFFARLFPRKVERVRDEVRLFTRLFSRSTSALDSALLHRLGLHLLELDGALFVRWRTFYLDHGLRESPAWDSQSGLDAFGAAVGLYGVAPGLLRCQTPKTFAFIEAELGAALAGFRAPDFEGAAVQFFHGRGRTVV